MGINRAQKKSKEPFSQSIIKFELTCDPLFISEEESEPGKYEPLGPLLALAQDEQPLPFRIALEHAYENNFESIEKFYESEIEDGERVYQNLKFLKEEHKGLDEDEVLAVYFFTISFPVRELSVYRRLNQDLTSEDRETSLPKWRFYIYHLFNAMSKIPIWNPLTLQDVYRGVNVNLVKKYPQKYKKGNEIIWYTFTSTTLDISKVQNFLQREKNESKEGTIFTLNNANLSGRDIRFYSRHKEEVEVLFPPGSRFSIISILNLDDIIPFSIIQLKQLPTLEVSLKNLVHNFERTGEENSSLLVRNET